MDREPELKSFGAPVAKQVMAAGGVREPRVEVAFAVVAREDFLAPGPWQIARWGGGHRAKLISLRHLLIVPELVGHSV